ncbi:hypothetical protein R1flu_006285 [Riccia fluitans]|uniref:U3 small nucleolar RNA-associated protein 11 n=1 Tax=Riccia fluitans TaxID=41844 RepID=A0ABD1YW82_9MARC
MSSLRNAVKRKTHKERAQPSYRAKYGILEKHKDYVLRAKDFHKKEKEIKILQEKASFRNPDEFYFKMINSQTVNGIHRQKNGGKIYTQEEIMLMKTQDLRYVLNKAQAEKKKVERLQSVLHQTALPPANTHVYFAEDSAEVKEIAPVAAVKPSQVLPQRIRKKQESGYRELAERRERAEKLKNMTVTMSLKKQIMGKGRKRKLKDSEVDVKTVVVDNLAADEKEFTELLEEPSLTHHHKYCTVGRVYDKQL